MSKIVRLNWGCGGSPAPGWINCDIKSDPWIDLSCDIRDGLPLEDASIDYIVTIHALPEIAYPDLINTLSELRRVLKDTGTLRLAVPDFNRTIEAYRSGDKEHFLIPDKEAKSLDAKFITYAIWYGYTRTLFTFKFVEELLQKAEFSNVVQCSYKETNSSIAEIVELDDRPNESLFVEATK